MRIYIPENEETLESIVEHIWNASRNTDDLLYCIIGENKVICSNRYNKPVMSDETGELDNSNLLDKERASDFKQILALLLQYQQIAAGRDYNKFKDDENLREVRAELTTCLSRWGERMLYDCYVVSYITGKRRRRVYIK